MANTTANNKIKNDFVERLLKVSGLTIIVTIDKIIETKKTTHHASFFLENSLIVIYCNSKSCCILI